MSTFDGDDIRAFVAGTQRQLACRFGVHPLGDRGDDGVEITVWAPRAQAVAFAFGSSGGESFDSTPLRAGDHGLWHGRVKAAGIGDRYRFLVTGTDGETVAKADPLARAAAPPPSNDSVIAASSPAQILWSDGDWLAARAKRSPLRRPLWIYELHPSSWRRAADDSALNWRELAPLVIEHQRQLGFSHVELMAVLDHPFGGSWGYHVSGYFAPNRRHGTPTDFATFIDRLHGAGIGVIVDWVPAHFATDSFGLARFDGDRLYEYADRRIGEHPQWGSLVFDYGRPQVRAFLLSSALWWLEQYHVDGLRVDAVASMLLRDFGRDGQEWVPNVDGGPENFEAISLLRQITAEIHRAVPGTLVIAEQSTSWPGVTADIESGGLGFDLSWDLGWAHDMLGYLARDYGDRRRHQTELSFRSLYQHSERFVLPLSHDEVTGGKGPLLARMVGGPQERLANLRLLLGNQFTLPGIPLIFQGTEIASDEEFHDVTMPPWGLLDDDAHRGIFQWVRALSDLRASNVALYRYQADLDNSGFEWLAADDAAVSALAYLRRADRCNDDLLIAVTFAAAAIEHYRISLPDAGSWQAILCSDEPRFGGSGRPITGRLAAISRPYRSREYSTSLTLPPLTMIVYRRVC